MVGGGGASGTSGTGGIPYQNLVTAGAALLRDRFLCALAADMPPSIPMSIPREHRDDPNQVSGSRVVLPRCLPSETG